MRSRFCVVDNRCVRSTLTLIWPTEDRARHATGHSPDDREDFLAMNSQTFRDLVVIASNELLKRDLLALSQFLGLFEHRFRNFGFDRGHDVSLNLTSICAGVMVSRPKASTRFDWTF